MNDTTTEGPAIAGEEPDPPPPVAGECVLCYVARMLELRGCDTTLRWARRWRDLRLPRATGLERRLEARGGFCDCEVFMNGWMLRSDVEVLDDAGDVVWPIRPAPCRGVSSRSSQPCAQWAPMRRPRW